jgi:hypothetical protein
MAGAVRLCWGIAVMQEHRQNTPSPDCRKEGRPPLIISAIGLLPISLPTGEMLTTLSCVWFRLQPSQSLTVLTNRPATCSFF